jgi:phosphatidylglycerophosphatase A
MIAQTQPRPIEFIHKLFATGFYSGYMPIAPGTWGSLVACIILWFVWPDKWYYQALAIAAFYPFAVYFSDQGVRYFGHDGRQIVIDEVIGQAVSLFMAPHNIIGYISGFFLFRLFDIVKLPPARDWEKLRGGYGIVADDIAAGVYAAIVLQLLVILSQRMGLELM